ncbi:UNVERIFIED_CONTAM: hypothetical protein NCL1_09419 [Trichonephila clavipes]
MKSDIFVIPTLSGLPLQTQNPTHIFYYDVDNLVLIVTSLRTESVMSSILDVTEDLPCRRTVRPIAVQSLWLA